MMNFETFFSSFFRRPLKKIQNQKNLKISLFWSDWKVSSFFIFQKFQKWWILKLFFSRFFSVHWESSKSNLKNPEICLFRSDWKVYRFFICQKLENRRLPCLSFKYDDFWFWNFFFRNSCALKEKVKIKKEKT